MSNHYETVTIGLTEPRQYDSIEFRLINDMNIANRYDNVRQRLIRSSGRAHSVTETSEILTELRESLVPYIESWTLTDEQGEPLPVSIESMRQLSGDAFTLIYEAFSAAQWHWFRKLTGAWGQRPSGSH